MATNLLITLFLCGDVMTGRGIDQILPHSVNPVLYESHVRDARDYVALAERVSGPIPRPVDYDYIWGDALDELKRVAPDVRIINLETAVTTHDRPWPQKPINYRMHPANVPALTAAGIDVCVLANNHTLDWMQDGLLETLDALTGAGMRFAGAGRTAGEASAPAIVDLGSKGRVVVFGLGHPSAGVFREWNAEADRPGVHVAHGRFGNTTAKLQETIASIRKPGDVVVVSIHWGGNWGYTVPREMTGSRIG